MSTNQRPLSWKMEILIACLAGGLVGVSLWAGSMNLEMHRSVSEVHLGDGTRCAVLKRPGDGSLAIDCEWKRWRP